MSKTECAGWLRDYAENGCGDAFGKLVAAHFDLVYSAALRLAGGDAHLAQDVAQTVFADLARKAKSLPREVYLGGWLYRHTCFTASKFVRSERRRQNRERQAVELNLQNNSSEVEWQQLAPLLEEAMQRLTAADRDAIVLRYFERQPFRAVGETLGTSEDAARKRVDRAVGQLREYFGRQGVTVSAAVLAGALNSSAVVTAPAGLAAAVAAGSLASAAAGAGTGSTIIKLIAMTAKMKIAGAIVAAGMAAAIVYQSQLNAKLREQNRALGEQISQLELRNNHESPPMANATPALSDEQLRDLLRLRNEVGTLKHQLAEATKERDLNAARLAQQPSSAEPPVDPAEQQKQMATAKMNGTRVMLLALRIFADDHSGTYPTDLEQVASYYDHNQVSSNLTDQLEIVYPGPNTDGSNLPPDKTIVLREKQAWQSLDGGWMKAYGFLDGHSEIHKGSDDGSFEPWESQRLQKPPGQ